VHFGRNPQHQLAAGRLDGRLARLRTVSSIKINGAV
jgi:hypothetical protein